MSTQTPPVNFWETHDSYQAAVLAPGLDKRSIDVTVREDTLTVEGELRVPSARRSRMVWHEFGPARSGG